MIGLVHWNSKTNPGSTVFCIMNCALAFECQMTILNLTNLM